MRKGVNDAKIYWIIFLYFCNIIIYGHKEGNEWQMVLIYEGILTEEIYKKLRIIYNCG